MEANQLLGTKIRAQFSNVKGMYGKKNRESKEIQNLKASFFLYQKLPFLYIRVRRSDSVHESASTTNSAWLGREEAPAVGSDQTAEKPRPFNCAWRMNSAHAQTHCLGPDFSFSYKALGWIWLRIKFFWAAQPNYCSVHFPINNLQSLMMQPSMEKKIRRL